MKNIVTNEEAIQFLTNNKIERVIDNTILRQDATEEDIEDFILQSLKYNFWSVCLNPVWVKRAKELTDGKIGITTVVGFPLGANTTETKLFETEEAIKSGATEIDMVINIGWLKAKRYKEVEQEISKIKNISANLILKVIIETCLLTKEEIITIIKIIENSGADIVKSSTGFSKHGATVEDIKFIKSVISNKNIGIKASGGIKDFETVKEMIYAGATRIGTSNGFKIIKELIEKRG